MNQHELEQEMIDGGINRARKMFENNEASGNAAANPYASAIFRRFVLPLAALVKSDIDRKLAGRAQAHVALLKGMDAEAIAFIAVRGVLCELTASTQDDEDGVDSSARDTAARIGRMIHSEYVLTRFQDINPELYNTIVREFDRRMSKSERHRMTVFKMQAVKAGIDWIDWGQSGQVQVGGYLLDLLEQLGMVVTFCADVFKRGGTSARTGNTLRASQSAVLAPAVVSLMDGIQGHVELATPELMPCVVPPVDWTELADGGWHTAGMRRAHPFCIKSPNRDWLRTHDLSRLFGTINHLQKVRWQVNNRILDAVRKVAEHFDMDEIVSQAEFPAPERPGFLDSTEKDSMTEQQLAVFTQWKREKAEWHTQMKLRGTKWGRYFTATRMAHKFKDERAIHFVYFADFRGRMYAQTTGISPQGSDMQKALLRFADGHPITTDEQREWFLINGANRFGVDKVSMADRVQWVKDNHEHIMSFARDPIRFNAWREADKPFQFLAWAFEYYDFNTFGPLFRTHIPVGMDGSCNGLQNFSAMLRDEVGGAAVNLVPADLPKDIYANVAVVTMEKLRRAPADPDGFRDLWIQHIVNRSLVKRSVMTLPYGSTRFSCADFIKDDYLRMGKAPEFKKEQYGKAAAWLSKFVWDSIGDVVIKARAAMDWLQVCSGKIIKADAEYISWVTPSGFPVSQVYQKCTEHRINTRLCGGAKLMLRKETDGVDGHRHRNGIAPNFIHSMDASHLSLTVLAAAHCGIDALAMIHDDYGTHATFAPQLARLIRTEFVGMYETSSPLEDFAAQYDDLPAPPERGTLDLSGVLESKYFFG